MTDGGRIIPPLTGEFDRERVSVALKRRTDLDNKTRRAAVHRQAERARNTADRLFDGTYEKRWAGRMKDVQSQRKGAADEPGKERKAPDELTRRFKPAHVVSAPTPGRSFAPSQNSPDSTMRAQVRYDLLSEHATRLQRIDKAVAKTMKSLGIAKSGGKTKGMER